MSEIVLTTKTAPSATPASGRATMWVNTSDELVITNDAGVSVPVVPDYQIEPFSTAASPVAGIIATYDTDSSRPHIVGRNSSGARVLIDENIVEAPSDKSNLAIGQTGVIGSVLTTKTVYSGTTSYFHIGPVCRISPPAITTATGWTYENAADGVSAMGSGDSSKRMRVGASGTDHFRFYGRTAPVDPFAMTVGFYLNNAYQENYFSAGIAFIDTTNFTERVSYHTYLSYGTHRWRRVGWCDELAGVLNDTHSINHDIGSPWYNALFWMRVRKVVDGANFNYIFEESPDGVWWTQHSIVASTEFGGFQADKIGIIGKANNGNSVPLDIILHSVLVE